MKKKYTLSSLLFGWMLLFAIVLQSADSFHHIEETFTEKKCLHKNGGNQAEIIHGHHDIEHCFVCEFTFSTVVATDTFSFDFQKITLPTSNSFFNAREITQFFKGSLFALRAPPVFIA